MTYGLWDVQGKIIIPGTRKSASFGPVRIGDVNRTVASKHLAKMLNEKFARDLRGDHNFSDHFAIYNLQWKDFQTTAPKAAEVVPVPMDDRNDPPALMAVAE